MLRGSSAIRSLGVEGVGSPEDTRKFLGLMKRPGLNKLPPAEPDGLATRRRRWGCIGNASDQLGPFQVSSRLVDTTLEQRAAAVVAMIESEPMSLSDRELLVLLALNLRVSGAEQ